MHPCARGGERPPGWRDAESGPGGPGAPRRPAPRPFARSLSLSRRSRQPIDTVAPPRTQRGTCAAGIPESVPGAQSRKAPRPAPPPRTVPGRPTSAAPGSTPAWPLVSNRAVPDAQARRIFNALPGPGSDAANPGHDCAEPAPAAPRGKGLSPAGPSRDRSRLGTLRGPRAKKRLAPATAPPEGTASPPPLPWRRVAPGRERPCPPAEPGAQLLRLD